MTWLESIRTWCVELEIARASGPDNLPFHQFAEAKLSDAPFSGFQLEDFLRDYSKVSQDLPQLNPYSKFGDPAVTIYYSSTHDFVLDLYVWNDSHTDIHDHGFEGAFTVLEGQSLEAEYEFQTSQEIGNSRWGKLVPKKLRLLKPRDVRPILPNRGTIHQVLHLERPTVSLALRTASNAYNIIQFKYSFGTLASPSFPPPDVVLKFKLFDWFLRSSHQLPKNLLEDLSAHADLWKKLFAHPTYRNLALKYLNAQKKSELLEGFEKQNVFDGNFNLIQNSLGKILFTAYHFFGPENWQIWVERNYPVSGNLKTLLRNELSAISFDWKSNRFYRDLFEVTTSV